MKHQSKINFTRKPLVLLISGLFLIPFTASISQAQTLQNNMSAVALYPADYIAPTFGKEVKSILELQLTQPLKKAPKFFNISGTNKIVVDIFDADRNISIPNPAANDPLVAKVSTKVVGDRVRFLIDTKFPVKFGYVSEDSKNLIVFEKSEKYVNALETAETTQMIETAKITTSNQGKDTMKLNVVDTPVSTVVANTGVVFSEVTKVNMKKEGQNFKATIELSDKNAAVTFKKDKDKLIVDFKNVSLSPKVQKRVSVSELGTVTSHYDASMQNANGRLVFEQKDDWDYSYFQMDNKLVVEIKAIDAKTDEKKFIGKPISLNFQSMEVRAILQVIADFTQLNILTSDKVNGAMTVRLKDVPWDQALDLVLESQNLQKLQEGNVIWIATRDELALNNKVKLELKTQKDELEPVKLEFFQLNYYQAKEFKKLIEGQISGDNASNINRSNNNNASILSKRGTVGTDERNNILFVQDTEDNLKGIRNLIKKLDVPTRQVLIEAKVIIADDRFTKDLGIAYGANGTTGSPSTAMTTTTQGALNVTFLRNLGGVQLNAAIAALEQNRRGKVLSSPRLLTSDNKNAVIEQGTEIPYVTPASSGTGTATVSFKKATLKLDVKPHIAPNGKVELELKIQKDSVGELVSVAGGGQVPSIDTKNMQTNIVVNNGQTVVLGGVYEITNTKSINSVPFLSSIPYLGELFKSTTNSENKGELLILITPTMIDDRDLDSLAKNPEAVTEISTNSK